MYHLPEQKAQGVGNFTAVDSAGLSCQDSGAASATLCCPVEVTGWVSELPASQPRTTHSTVRQMGRTVCVSFTSGLRVGKKIILFLMPLDPTSVPCPCLLAGSAAKDLGFASPVVRFGLHRQGYKGGR